MADALPAPQWLTDLLAWRSPRPPEEQPFPERVWSRFAADPVVQEAAASGAVQTWPDLERLYAEFVDREYGAGRTAND